MSRRPGAPKYGFWKFMGDILMFCLLNIFWLIWIFIREMRYSSR